MLIIVYVAYHRNVINHGVPDQNKRSGNHFGQLLSCLQMHTLWFLLCLILVSHGVVIDVWPHFAPGEHSKDPGHITPDHSGNVTRITNVTSPRLSINLLPKRAQPYPAVIVNPGGGYSILAVDIEGSEIASWLNSQGFVTAVHTYRVPGKRDGAYQDIQRAVSVLRSRAAEFNIDPNKIGVIGFSAGGHLTARVSSSDGKRTYDPVDDHDKVSFLPNFSLLVYPAYLLDQSKQPAIEVKPRQGMHPLFMEQTRDDHYFCVEQYSAALDKVGVSNKLVVYDKGGHGYGLRLPTSLPAHEWSLRAQEWLIQFK
jgi:acetyl esterase/lipase